VRLLIGVVIYHGDPLIVKARMEKHTEEDYY
jgi:hypothetical protein